MDDNRCQNQDLRPASGRLSRVSILTHQVRWHLENRGLFPTLRRILSFLVERAQRSLRLKRKAVKKQPVRSYNEVLNLQPGEWVEVKPEDEILKTLDENGRNLGLSFDAEMRKYCGGRLRVFRRVERICMESSPGEVRRLKNTVILEGVICEGTSIGCDRACFYFWREAWLQRVQKD